jgi:hypothetical protein
MVNYTPLPRVNSIQNMHGTFYTHLFYQQIVLFRHLAGLTVGGILMPHTLFTYTTTYHTEMQNQFRVHTF